jgi:hypothetical protein
MVLASKLSALLLLLDLALLSLLGPPTIPGGHNPRGLCPTTLFVHPCPPDVELMISLDMLSVIFHFGGGFDADGDFVNYINEH